MECCCCISIASSYLTSPSEIELATNIGAAAAVTLATGLIAFQLAGHAATVQPMKSVRMPQTLPSGLVVHGNGRSAAPDSPATCGKTGRTR